MMRVHARPHAPVRSRRRSLADAVLALGPQVLLSVSVAFLGLLWLVGMPEAIPAAGATYAILWAAAVAWIYRIDRRHGGAR